MVAWVSAYMLLYMLSGITEAWFSSHVLSYVLSGVEKVSFLSNYTLMWF